VRNPLWSANKDVARQSINSAKAPFHVKLQTKFILVLLSTSLLALIGSQVFQQYLSTKALKDFGNKNLDSLEKREQRHAEDIFQAADPIVQQTIAGGEMTKVYGVIQTFTNIDGILEYSIYDHDGAASFSSSRQVLISKKTLPANITNLVLHDPAKLSTQTSDALEIYRPLVVTSKCL
jgi:hypothetical protein